MSGTHEDSIRDEFTHQTDAFARAPAMGARRLALRNCVIRWRRP